MLPGDADGVYGCEKQRRGKGRRGGVGMVLCVFANKCIYEVTLPVMIKMCFIDLSDIDKKLQTTWLTLSQSKNQGVPVFEVPVL